MAVYVDKMRAPLRWNGRGIPQTIYMSHMLADTVDELHAMADKIGVNRRHFQPKSSPHYDVCQSKRKLAIQHGAIEVDNRQLVAIIRKLRGNP